MAQFKVTAPDGSTYRVNAPEGANEQDAIAYVQRQFSASPQQEPVNTPDRRLVIGRDKRIPMANAAQAGRMDKVGMGEVYRSPEWLRSDAERQRRSRYAMTHTGGTARALVRGVPALGGFADEAEAGIKSAFGADYGTELERIRTANE